ncbi:MAG: UDP-glucose 6-dehydrogenase [candidate division TM6 bacterium GW2011_GWF2_38_10]|nr:MAG: UDP-glucose 6-dehydrogenase [candidate division TM6 bacterium GW2011_GWF2_38_10]
MINVRFFYFFILIFINNVININAFITTTCPQNIAIVGSGYVGIVSGAGLAELGHNVVCLDIDEKKINTLNQGKMPIYEPGLEELVLKNIDNKQLYFSSDIESNLRNASIIIIAVGTPMGDDGNANLSALWAVVDSIAKVLKPGNHKLVCIKSTVPIKTHNKVQQRLSTLVEPGASYNIISNPEFLREGSAINDFFFQNPIVLGGDNEKALECMVSIYEPLIKNGSLLIKTDNASAEMIKYAWNAYSAIKISYINQLSLLCNKVDANIVSVIQGIAQSEKLLPISKVRPGPGFGGSCLPKDTAAFAVLAQHWGIDLSLVKEARNANVIHKQNIVESFIDLCSGSVKDKKIGILGLAFKANTDDIRYSPALDIIPQLLQEGALIYAYDPKAMDNMKKELPSIQYAQDVYGVIDNADALLVLTEWDEFKHIDIEYIKDHMKNAVLMDTRNVFDGKLLSIHGIFHKSLGYK